MSPKSLALIVLTLTTQFTIAQELSFPHYGDGPPNRIFFKDHQLYSEMYSGMANVEIAPLENSVFALNNGYYYTATFDNESYFAIPGHNLLRMDVLQDSHKKTIERRKDKESGKTNPNGAELPFHSKNIEAVTSSSFLKEGNVDYSSNNLLERWWIFGDWNPLGLPWVEGKTGPGINEFIEVTFKRPTKSVSILGGFVDPLKPSLFIENNRPKKLKITWTSQTKTGDLILDLDDKITFTPFKLPMESTKVKITILEAFKGTKFDDTCISAIMGF